MTAHSGEDQWLLSLWPPDFKGFAVEAGACDGLHMSNTLTLERHEWTVLAIEPNPHYHEALKRNRKLVELCALSDSEGIADFHVHTPEPSTWSSLSKLPEAPGDGPHWSTIQVPTQPLDRLLERHRFPRLDVLSLDLDGGESKALRGFSFHRWQPQAVIIESLKGNTFTPRLADLGYGLAERRDVNDLYLRKGFSVYRPSP